MSNIEQVTYTAIKTNKGKPRLWIEGAKLDAAGFKRGQLYNVEVTDSNVFFTLDDEGNRKVSGRTRNGKDIPIIDCNLPQLYEVFGQDARVRVVFQQGKISVSLHHEQQAQQEREQRFIKNLQGGQLKEASLFTGGAISTTAIHDAVKDAGITGDLCWVVDCELKYLQSAAANSWAINDNTTFLVGRAEEIESQFFTKVDLLSFSMPCSGFSRAGTVKHKQTSEEHEGGTSLFGVLNAVRTANPALLVSENVTEAQGSPIYTLLISELKRLGYTVLERVLSNADTGTFEARSRYWFIAISEGLADDLAFDLADVMKQSRILSDFMDSEVPEDMWADNAYLKDKAVRDAEAGKGFANRQLLTGSESKIGTIGRHYAKRRSTEPFIIREDGKERLLTPAEHARVKSVPEALVKDTPMTTAHQILGQGIDYLQAYLPVRKLIENLLGKLAVPCAA